MAANNLLIARRYAQAALELALEQNTLEQWRGDLATLAQVWAGTGIAVLLDDPKLGRGRRMSEARRLLEPQVSPLALNLVLLLIERGRARLVPQVATAFDRLVRRHEGRIEAQVTSAVALTDAQRQGLRDQLGRRTGQIVELKEQIDPSILGGLIIRVGDELIDASIAGRLRRIEAQLSS